MNTPRSPRLFAVVFAALAAAWPLRADWRDEIGYTRLQQTFTTGVPTSVAGGVTQAEAGDKDGNFYLPDANDGQIANKTLNNKSTGSGGSGHATYVGAHFYGNTFSLVPATTLIDAYNANGWLYDDFLKFNTASDPLTENRKVQNHSWISIFDTTKNTPATITAAVANINQRLDFAINRDGFSSVVGANNGASTTLPDLLCQTYHTLSVGLVNGQHSAGLTTHDGEGRMKPDLVAFESLTSFATPQVSSAAGLISEKLRTTTYSPALTNADYPRLTKALLLAGAAKEPLATWSRASTTKPYDSVYGAGALNILLSYRILAAGQKTPSAIALVADTGWASGNLRSSTNPQSRTYYFEIPSGSTSAPFSAALTWHRAINQSAVLANLDLTLYAVNAGTFTLGGEIDSSASTVDNVEHIYRSSLPPGRYALQVSSSSTTSTAYALAWRASPTVTVAPTNATAREIDGSPATFTVTRTGPTTSPLFVPLIWGGTATAGSHYSAAPASVLIPEGASTATVQITPIADTLAQGDRTVTLAVLTDYSLSAGTPANGTVTIQDKPYDTWRVTRFTTNELTNSAVSGESADPDNDGLANLMEYALNAEPKATDTPAIAPIVGTAGDRLTLTYTRPTTIIDVSYAVEWSGDLQTWSTGATATETVNTTDNGNGTTTVIVRSVATLTDTPRQFLRLRVTKL